MSGLIHLFRYFRGLLDDPTFHKSVFEISNENVPYFGQLAKEEEENGDEQELKHVSVSDFKSANPISKTSNPLSKKTLQNFSCDFIITRKHKNFQRKKKNCRKRNLNHKRRVQN